VFSPHIIFFCLEPSLKWLFSEKGFRKLISRRKKEEKTGKERNFEENVGMSEETRFHTKLLSRGRVYIPKSCLMSLWQLSRAFLTLGRVSLTVVSCCSGGCSYGYLNFGLPRARLSVTSAMAWICFRNH